MLEDLVALEAGAGDEQGVLEVDLILLIVVVVGEFYEAEGGQVSGLIAVVGDDRTPNLIGCAVGHVIGHLRADVCIVGRDHSVCGAVTADALVGIQRLANRLPGSRPVICGVVVPQVDVTARQCHHRVEAIAADSAVCAGLDEAIAGSIVGNDCAVFRRTKVVDPRCRGIRMVDHILLVLEVKVTILHK